MKAEPSQANVDLAVHRSILERASDGVGPGQFSLGRADPTFGKAYLLGRTVVALLATASVISFAYQLLWPKSIHVAGLTIDRLSAALTLLVAGVGAVNFRYSRRYLDGDPRQGRFIAWMVFSLVCAYVLMLATNLLLFAAVWALTSVGLHQLLTHYPERVDALRAARKKFLISRLGDLALVGLIVCAWSNWHTFDLNEVLANLPAEKTVAMTTAAVLIVLAAVTKSAQVPFHSWLPETMESPTPVSALMHAGIINAGGALLLRTAPLIVHVPEALLLLSVIGTATAVLGAVCMWAQVKVKRTLAWSTVSQMGFMTAQCGLAAFPAALLHIIAHGCYKAWSFLRAGDISAVTTATPSAGVGRTLTCVLCGNFAAGLAMPIASRLSGFMPLHSPGETALAVVLALSVGQVWAAILGRRLNGRRSSEIYAVALAAVFTGVVTVAAFGLYQVAAWYLSPVLGRLSYQGGWIVLLAAIVPATGLLGLTVLHALLPTLSIKPIGFALRVHALHGFYLGAVADRAVETIWKAFSKRSDKP